MVPSRQTVLYRSQCPIFSKASCFQQGTSVWVGQPKSRSGLVGKRVAIQDTSTMCPKTYDLGTRNKGSSRSHLAVIFPWNEEMRWPLQWSHYGRLYCTDPSVGSSASIVKTLRGIIHSSSTSQGRDHLRSGRTGSQLQMNRFSLRNNRWKLETAGKLPLILRNLQNIPPFNKGN